MADPAAQELALLGHPANRTLGFVERGGSFVGCRLRCAQGVRGALRPVRCRPVRCPNVRPKRSGRSGLTWRFDATVLAGRGLDPEDLGTAASASAADKSTSPSPA